LSSFVDWRARIVQNRRFPREALNVPQILVQELSKSYLVSEREAGAWGAVKGLIRRRRRVIEALKGISFSLDRGELLGFIGPNGAGKSTNIKILSGILRPSSGSCEVQGLVPWRDRIQHVARIGVVFGQRTQLWWDLPVIEGFELLRDIYRVEDSAYRKSLDAMVSLMRLERLLDQPVRQLSFGQRMRCEIASARDPVPRRADDRARCAFKARGPRVRRDPESRGRRDRHPDYARHA
jgi:viologen exporter family transport system ATP-binding protein